MAAAAIVLGTVASYALGVAAGVPALMPLLNTAASYPFMVAALRRGDLRAAIARMLIWALAMGLCATAIAYLGPWDASKVFLNGARYREEMFIWVMTGRGAESSPAAFIPQHALHTAIFTVVTLATAGFGGMAMGAVLMNYMATYVGSLAAASAHPVAAATLGWHPWSIIRIVSFVVIGVVLAVPLLSRALHFTADAADRRRLLQWAAGGLVADVVLKALLAPTWQRLLLRIAGW